MADSIRLLIADDHPIVRAGMQGMLANQADFEVVGEAATGTEAVALAAKLRPDVVLMDLRMPEMDGVTAIIRIRAEQPDVHVLVLTTYDSDSDILRAVEAGATGYMLKDAPREEIFHAVRSAAQGKAVLAPAVAARLMGRMRAPGEEALSFREIEVLTLVARGVGNQEAAYQLHISEATVKSHLVRIYGKLGVADRAAAVAVALNRGILRLD